MEVCSRFLINGRNKNKQVPHTYMYIYNTTPPQTTQHHQLQTPKNTHYSGCVQPLGVLSQPRITQLPQKPRWCYWVQQLTVADDEAAAVDLAPAVFARAAGGGGGTNAGSGMCTGVNSLLLSAVCWMRLNHRSRLQKPSNCAPGMLACMLFTLCTHTHRYIHRAGQQQQQCDKWDKWDKWDNLQGLLGTV